MRRFLCVWLLLLGTSYISGWKGLDPCEPGHHSCKYNEECVPLLGYKTESDTRNYRCDCLFLDTKALWGPNCDEECDDPLPTEEISICANDDNVDYDDTYDACEEQKVMTERRNVMTEDQLLEDCSKPPAESKFGGYFCEGACQNRYKTNLIKSTCADGKCICTYCTNDNWNHDDVVDDAYDD